MKVKNYDNTLIERIYSNKVTRNLKNDLLTTLESEIERDITYNKIIADIQDLGYDNYWHELQYRLAIDEDINKVLMSIITRSSETKSTIGYHKNTIQHYLDQDLMNLFK